MPTTIQICANVVGVICVLLLTSCGPESPEAELMKNVRVVCEFGRGVCYGEGVVADAVDECIEAQAVQGLANAERLGEDCVQLYHEFYKCAAESWGCEVFLKFTMTPDAPCQDLRSSLLSDCPNLSPFQEDKTEPATASGET